ncbi:MAG: 4Fe-4S dicluster domain-containing protein [Gemmatimonadaceae bacterium]|jgi:Pyruvate/2-oxoacid:ferredoxin oxidoreductase delta subunit|nr:4Fe-4S dicluster domain-containing protein [Gemmatimonadaceae bacterium]
MPRTPAWTPSAEQQALWPARSGNVINGVGEARVRRPSPVYWHDPDVTAHGPLQRWFLARLTPPVLAARAERIAASEVPLAPLAATPTPRTADEWTARVRAVAREAGADAVGIAEMQPHWVFEGHEVVQRWVIVIAVRHDWEALRTAPHDPAAAEVIRQYGRGIRVAKAIASAIRGDGHDAVPQGGPMAYPMLLIPAAIAAGLGELGKYGSLIHRTLGSNFRLACVLTDIPLVASTPDDFGADDFCTRCRACADACPPQAIGAEKQLVRGAHKWYVDFDRCLPFFNEHQGCAICLAVCPWNYPGVAKRLVTKLATRRARRATARDGA